MKRCIIFAVWLFLLFGCSQEAEPNQEQQEQTTTPPETPAQQDDYAEAHLIRVLASDESLSYPDFAEFFIPETLHQQDLLDELEYKYIMQQASDYLKRVEQRGFVHIDTSQLYYDLLDYTGPYDLSELLLSWYFYPETLQGLWVNQDAATQYFELTDRVTTNFNQDQSKRTHHMFRFEVDGIFSWSYDWEYLDLYQITLMSDHSMELCLIEEEGCNLFEKHTGTHQELEQLTQKEPIKQEETCEARIKGNINKSSKEWIYHVPGGAYYERTQAEMLFCTEEEAIAAGFRKSKR